MCGFCHDIKHTGHTCIQLRVFQKPFLQGPRELEFILSLVMNVRNRLKIRATECPFKVKFFEQDQIWFKTNRNVRVFWASGISFEGSGSHALPIVEAGAPNTQSSSWFRYVGKRLPIARTTTSELNAFTWFFPFSRVLFFT